LPRGSPRADGFAARGRAEPAESISRKSAWCGRAYASLAIKPGATRA
jgi:hypothetical protein